MSENLVPVTYCVAQIGVTVRLILMQRTIFPQKHWVFSFKLFNGPCTMVLACTGLWCFIVAARHCRVSLATPRPFLGVSSLNLAAPSGAAFFFWNIGRDRQPRPHGLSRSPALSSGGDLLRRQRARARHVQGMHVDPQQTLERSRQARADRIEMRVALDAFFIEIQRAVHLDL